MCQMSHAMCQIGHVTCPLLHVTFHCQVSNVKKKKVVELICYQQGQPCLAYKPIKKLKILHEILPHLAQDDIAILLRPV